MGWWGVYGKGNLGVSFLRGSMCAEGMGCKKRWVRWVLRGIETVSEHPGVSWKISPRRLSQPAVCSKMRQPELAAARTASLLEELVGVAVPFFLIRDFLNVETKNFFCSIRHDIERSLIGWTKREQTQKDWHSDYAFQEKVHTFLCKKENGGRMWLYPV